MAAALTLALLAVGLLMYFIHHIAGTLEAGEILSSVVGEALAVVERLFPEELGTRAADMREAHVSIPEGPWRVIAGFALRLHPAHGLGGATAHGG